MEAVSILGGLRKKKIKIILFAVMTMAVFIALTACVCRLAAKKQGEKHHNQQAEENIENYEIESMGIDAADEAAPSEDVLMFQAFDFISNADMFPAGGYIDVRIAFPNGVDCVILSHKKIIKNADGNIMIAVFEDEILRMSSAYFDTKRYADCSVYAVGYMAETLSYSICDYPVNKDVYKMCIWNPNAGKTEEVQNMLQYAQKRTELENSLEPFLIN